VAEVGVRRRCLDEPVDPEVPGDRLGSLSRTRSTTSMAAFTIISSGASRAIFEPR